MPDEAQNSAYSQGGAPTMFLMVVKKDRKKDLELLSLGKRPADNHGARIDVIPQKQESVAHLRIPFGGVDARRPKRVLQRVSEDDIC
jgi:hypothetical protein